MFNRESYISRREELMRRLGGGVVLLLGNSLVPFNYKNNSYPFRQDSTFRYFFGVNRPSLVGVIDIDAGLSHLFGDEFTLDDIIWSGEQPSIKEQGAASGVELVHPLAELKPLLERIQRAGRVIHTLPPYRVEEQLHLSQLLEVPINQIFDYKSIELIFAVAQMREIKSCEELAAIDDAFQIGYSMHTAAMKLCREGVVEREIAAHLEGIARGAGAGVSFPTIATQRGEQLHCISQDGVLRSGSMFLCDAGAESLSGYCSDNTRSYPVDGRFTPLQGDLYNIVLAAYNRVLDIARPMPYMELHRQAQLAIAEGLEGVGLVRGAAQDVVDSGAVTLFMPHGLGHGLGMDVHDCENLGERSFDYSSLVERASQDGGTSLYRASWQLREGTVLTNEPGLYFIPALIEKRKAEGAYRGVVNYSALESLYGFGGIRIEDTITITEGGCRLMGEQRIPITIAQIEEFRSR